MPDSRLCGEKVTKDGTGKVLSDLAYLLGCAVRSEVPEKRDYDLDALYGAASKHLVAAAAGMALESAGIENEKFRKAVVSAIRKAAIFESDFQNVSRALEDAGIWYMPLKGAVLKDWYPKYGMREMSDVDILFDAERADDVRDIMVSLGFEPKGFGKGAHDVYHKLPVSNFEMHRLLFSPANKKEIYEYYLGVKERLAGVGCRLSFTPNDFYVFILAHEYKHYSGGGTGLRSLLDIYICIKKLELDMEYISAETKKLGIADLERKGRELAIALFDGGELTDEQMEEADYFFTSGVYGTVDRYVSNRVERYGGGLKGRILYVIRRGFPSMDKIKASLPWFYRHKIFIPLIPFYVLYLALIKRRRRFTAEMKAVFSRKSKEK